MAHVVELARSGRAKCRGCGQALPKGEPRVGEKLPNPFADDGDMTLWFHPLCAAFKRPEVLLEALDTTDVEVRESERLRAEATKSQAHRRLPRIDGGARAPSGRARCRHCRELIDKGSVRVSIIFYEEGRFDPGGHVHARCAAEYFGTGELADRVRHFSPELDDAALAELQAALG
ncbi:MAG: hypothetical protein OXT09_26495 [Myxococcales bacterium]|nr:hypothetical protein [Myxococcales bacterium]